MTSHDPHADLEMRARDPWASELHRLADALTDGVERGYRLHALVQESDPVRALIEAVDRLRLVMDDDTALLFDRGIKSLAGDIEAAGKPDLDTAVPTGSGWRLPQMKDTGVPEAPRPPLGGTGEREDMSWFFGGRPDATGVEHAADFDQRAAA